MRPGLLRTSLAPHLGLTGTAVTSPLNPRWLQKTIPASSPINVAALPTFASAGAKPAGVRPLPPHRPRLSTCQSSSSPRMGHGTTGEGGGGGGIRRQKGIAVPLPLYFGIGPGAAGQWAVCSAAGPGTPVRFPRREGTPLGLMGCTAVRQLLKAPGGPVHWRCWDGTRSANCRHGRHVVDAQCQYQRSPAPTVTRALRQGGL